MQFIANLHIYGNPLPFATVKADTLESLKRKASRLCNYYFSPVDEMRVKCKNLDTGEITKATFSRINRKFPNNTIIRGKWG